MAISDDFSRLCLASRPIFVSLEGFISCPGLKDAGIGHKPIALGRWI